MKIAAFCYMTPVMPVQNNYVPVKRTDPTSFIVSTRK